MTTLLGSFFQSNSGVGRRSMLCENQLDPIYVRNGLEAGNRDSISSLQVKSIRALMLVKFNEEFGTGEQNSVATYYLSNGSRGV